MPDHRAEPDSRAQADFAEAERLAQAEASTEGTTKPRKRRVTTKAPAGSDPTPEHGPPRHRADDNDEQLKADVPPHWG
jgi:hypothetical protein